MDCDNCKADQENYCPSGKLTFSDLPKLNQANSRHSC
jgi:hypothetical protein